MPKKRKKSSTPRRGKEDVKKMSGFLSPLHQLDVSCPLTDNPYAEAHSDSYEPEIDSDPDGSEKGVTDAKEVTIFKGIDKLLPSFTLPPNNYPVQSYSALYNYFIQSPLIFDAFRQRFGLPHSVREC